MEGLPASPSEGFRPPAALTRVEFGKLADQVMRNLAPSEGPSPPAPRARLRDPESGPKVAPRLGKPVTEFWMEMDVSGGWNGEARRLLWRFPQGHWFYAQAQELLHAPVARMDEFVPFDSWTYDAMMKPADLGVVIGLYPDGTFRGNRALTRGEFGRWVWSVLRDMDRPRDAAADPWPLRERLRTDRQLAELVGVILAKLAEEFRPELELTATDEAGPLRRCLAAVPEGHWFRGQAQRLLATRRTEADAIAPPHPATPPPPAPAPTQALPAFPDVPEGHWAAAAVARVREAGIVEGYPGGEFGGGE
jgi:hypothetical protein